MCACYFRFLWVAFILLLFAYLEINSNSNQESNNSNKMEVRHILSSLNESSFIETIENIQINVGFYYLILNASVLLYASYKALKKKYVTLRQQS